MPQVIPFRPAQHGTGTNEVAVLAARLLQVETAETTDEDLMDLLLEAELAALGALSRAPAMSVAEVTLKLATVVRRLGEERDFPPCEGEIGLLQSVLRDLQRLADAPTVAAAATA